MLLFIDFSPIQLNIFYDKHHGYTAEVKELGIVTEGDTFDQLMYNVNEALELNTDIADKKQLAQTFFQFSLLPQSYAVNI